MTWLIGLGMVYAKTNQDNDLTDHTGAIYAKNKTEFSWPIRSGADFGENQIRQLRD